MSHLLLQSKLELRWNKRRSKESGSGGRTRKRDAMKDKKLARLAGNAWNVRTRSRTAFCVLVSVRIHVFIRAHVRTVSTVL